jgi:hypothetical protein
MCSILFGVGSAIWNRDIDKLAPPLVARRLIEATGATPEQFEQTTLRPFSGFLFERLNANGSSSWIVPLGIHRRSRSRPGLMFCPRCLESDEHPYFRRLWRIGFVTCCLAHRVELLDACPRCGSPVMPHRADMLGKTMVPEGKLITRCGGCGFDLSRSQSKPACDRIMFLQQLLEDALARGYVAWNGNPNMHSVAFFNGLRLLLSGLKHASRRRSSTCQLRRQFSHEILSVRMSYMNQLDEALTEWPTKFISHVSDSKFGSSVWCCDPAVSAFWYEDFIKRQCNAGQVPIGQDESRAIANYVWHKAGKATSADIRKVTGRDLSRVLKLPETSRVSDDDCVTLLASLDHQIADCQDRSARFILLRDKFMLATSRALTLTLGQVSSLNVNDVLCRAGDNTPNFLHPPTTPDDAYSWLSWYIVHIRNEFNPPECESGMFLCLDKGTRIKKSAISVRFKLATDSAFLSRQIPSFAHWRTSRRSVPHSEALR